jgi:CheY-like chemotaxis protein
MRALRVLVLDAHPIRRAALHELLAGWGVGVQVTGDADDAVKKVEATSPGQEFAIVLMTPVADSVEVSTLAGRLRDVSSTGDSPAIVQLSLSAHLMPGAAHGAWPMLSSPPRRSQMYDLLVALVDRKPDGLRRLASTETPAPQTAASTGDAARVLVIDDSDVNRRVAERMLARLGYRTESGDSGDATSFGDAAHVLKGGAATLGAARLRSAAYDLELRGRDHNLVGAEAQLLALETLWAEALEALTQEDSPPHRKWHADESR